MVTPDLRMLQKLRRPSAHPPPLEGGAVHRGRGYAWAMQAEANATEEQPTGETRALALRPISQGTLARTVPPGDALRELPSIVMAGLAALYGFTQAAMLLRHSDAEVLRLVKTLPGAGESMVQAVSVWLHRQRVAAGVPSSMAVHAQVEAQQMLRHLQESLVLAVQNVVLDEGMSVDELATRSGTRPHVVEALLRDVNAQGTPPRLELLARIAGGLGLRIALVPR